MIRKTMLALVLIAGLAGTGHAVAGPFLPRLDPPTAAELGLTAAQAAEWQAIAADAQSLRQATLDQVKAELDRTQVELSQADADLREIGREYQSIAFAALLEQRQLRDRRLAFYNGLNPQQQAQVRAFLLEVSERAERAIRAFEVLQGEG